MCAMAVGWRDGLPWVSLGCLVWGPAEITKRIGYIMVERNRVNLQNSFFDTPEFFWEGENEGFEPYTPIPCPTLF